MALLLGAIAPARVRRRTTVRAPNGAPQRGRHGLRQSNGDSGGSEAAASLGASAVPVGSARKFTAVAARVRQLRACSRAFSTFMLDTSTTRPLGRLSTIRAAPVVAVGRTLARYESFNYVCSIVTRNTNVAVHPIALHAARVYLRCRDARPDARIDHLQAPPLCGVRLEPEATSSTLPVEPEMFLRLLGALCLYRFSNEPHPTAPHLR